MKYLKAHFTDELHNEDIVIANSEESVRDPLSFELDGIKFAGNSFCDFELSDETQYDEAVNKFCILKYNGYDSKYYYGLQRYSLSVVIPIMLLHKRDGRQTEGILHYSFDMKKPEEGKHRVRSVCDGEDVYWDIIIPHNCSIFVGDGKYSSAVKSSDFESLLESLSEKMKDEYRIMSCFTCQYADYSPYGNDDFGTMLCYRRHKADCLKVNSKGDYFEFLEGKDCGARQETYLCDEYEFRNKSEGYRGFVNGTV